MIHPMILRAREKGYVGLQIKGECRLQSRGLGATNVLRLEVTGYEPRELYTRHRTTGRAAGESNGAAGDTVLIRFGTDSHRRRPVRKMNPKDRISTSRGEVPNTPTPSLFMSITRKACETVLCLSASGEALGKYAEAVAEYKAMQMIGMGNAFLLICPTQ